jgi:hypothetical protein
VSEITHAASIAVAKLKAAGRVEQPVQALLDLIEQMEREADDQQLEMASLRQIASTAQDAVDYHRAGRFGDPFYDEFWDADEMIARMENLEAVLK